MQPGAMVEIWHCDVRRFSEDDFGKLLQDCSEVERERILRFRFLKDRLFHLLGRKMVKVKCGVSANDFRVGSKGKPYLEHGPSFSISHAGTRVAVAFSTMEIGFDLEEKNAMAYDAVSAFFHPNERAFTEKTQNVEVRKDAFYCIWTRKEAFLKATGEGLLNGMDQFDCLTDEITFNNTTWYIESLEQDPDYAMALCCSQPIGHVSIQEFDPL